MTCSVLQKLQSHLNYLKTIICCKKSKLKTLCDLRSILYKFTSPSIHLHYQQALIGIKQAKHSTSLSCPSVQASEQSSCLLNWSFPLAGSSLIGLSIVHKAICYCWWASRGIPGFGVYICYTRDWKWDLESR